MHEEGPPTCSACLSELDPHILGDYLVALSKQSTVDCTICNETFEAIGAEPLRSKSQDLPPIADALCALCGTPFPIRFPKQLKRYHDGRTVYCSRRCSGFVNRRNLKWSKP